MLSSAPELQRAHGPNQHQFSAPVHTTSLQLVAPIHRGKQSANRCDPTRYQRPRKSHHDEPTEQVLPKGDLEVLKRSTVRHGARSFRYPTHPLFPQFEWMMHQRLANEGRNERHASSLAWRGVPKRPSWVGRQVASTIRLAYRPSLANHVLEDAR